MPFSKRTKDTGDHQVHEENRKRTKVNLVEEEENQVYKQALYKITWDSNNNYIQ